MIQISLGIPEHGWLPLEFSADDFVLYLDVSDVPVNPLAELCSALIIAFQGGTSEVGWHLEPAWCFFRFEHTGQKIILRILNSDGFGKQTSEIFQTTGTVDTVLMPFYRALKGSCM